MIRICAAVSGEVIAVIQAEDFEGTVKALKLFLAPRLDCSRFRQRLVSQDGLELCDYALVLPPANLQMILLQLRLPDTKEQEQLVARASVDGAANGPVGAGWSEQRPGYNRPWRDATAFSSAAQPLGSRPFAA
ncbi:unnamed protein product [Cladocopium goreaui]|uniref:Uncharacterized protein n=1 Tax=Cladocopium goreaui TaxID=2562237 RepID=A0A9P1CH85_9DINO|nr:unnamed protein product [Cladocopium goreaui]